MTISLTHIGKSTCAPRTTARMPSILTFLTVWKERRELANLDEARLKDIGLSAHDAAKEATRAVWDLPADRRI